MLPRYHLVHTLIFMSSIARLDFSLMNIWVYGLVGFDVMFCWMAGVL